MSRSGEYIRVLASDLTRWGGSAYGGGSIEYIGDVAPPVVRIQSFTTDLSPSIQGSDAAIVWTPLQHETVGFYNLDKAGNPDPAGNFDIASNDSMSFYYKNITQSNPYGFLGTGGLAAEDDVRPIIYVSGATAEQDGVGGAVATPDGWYCLSNLLVQENATTDWELKTFSNCLTFNNANNKWIGMADQETAIAGKSGTFRFQAYWDDLTPNVQEETTTKYNFSTGSITAIGIAVTGPHGIIPNVPGQQAKDISGTWKLDEIRVF